MVYLPFSTLFVDLHCYTYCTNWNNLSIHPKRRRNDTEIDAI